MSDLFRRAAGQIDKILKGGQTNRVAHRAAHQVRAGHQPQDGQGARVTIWQTLLLRADQVIE